MATIDVTMTDGRTLTFTGSWLLDPAHKVSTKIGSTPLDPRPCYFGVLLSGHQFYVFTYADDAATAATSFMGYQTWQEVMSGLPVDVWGSPHFDQESTVGLKTIVA